MLENPRGGDWKVAGYLWPSTDAAAPWAESSIHMYTSARAVAAESWRYLRHTQTYISKRLIPSSWHATSILA